MRLYRCDRCSREIEDATGPMPEGSRRPVVGVIVGGPLLGLAAPNPDYDLCADCAMAARRCVMAKPKPPKAKAKRKPGKHVFSKAETTNGWVIHWCSKCPETIKRPRDKGSSGKPKGGKK